MKHHDRELTLFLSSAVRLSLYRSSTVSHFVIRSAVEKSLRFNSDSFSASVFFFFFILRKRRSSWATRSH